MLEISCRGSFEVFSFFQLSTIALKKSCNIWTVSHPFTCTCNVFQVSKRCNSGKWSQGRLAFAHFLQLVMISFAHFLRLQLRTIFAPQSGAISGREKMTFTGNSACAMKSVTFSLMVLLNVVQSSFLLFHITYYFSIGYIGEVCLNILYIMNLSKWWIRIYGLAKEIVVLIWCTVRCQIKVHKANISRQKIMLIFSTYNTIIPTQCFYRFFGNFDWSVGKMKWFLHFNKNPRMNIWYLPWIHSASELYIHKTSNTSYK